MIKNYIFDWTGTIQDNLESFLKVCEIVFSSHGLMPPTKEYVRESFEMPWMKWWDKHIPGLPKEVHHEAYKKALMQTRPGKAFPGMFEVLAVLQEQGKTLFIISSDPKERLFQELGTRKELFKEVISEVYYKSEAILDLVEGYHLNPQETVYIGDVVGDATEAKKAGVHAWLVTWGFNNKEVLAKSKAERIIETPQELIDKT